MRAPDSVTAQGISMLLNMPAAHASCSRAGGRMASTQACSCTARSHAIWQSRFTRPAPRHVVASPARLHDHTVWRQHACSPRQYAVRHSIVAASDAPSDVLILDFDGVLVDSEPEASAPAWRLSAHLLAVGLLGYRDDSPHKAEHQSSHDLIRPCVRCQWRDSVQRRSFGQAMLQTPKRIRLAM